MQGRAIELVPTVDFDPLPEVEERHEHIFLSGQVEGIKAGLGGELVVNFVLLDEILDHI